MKCAPFVVEHKKHVCYSGAVHPRASSSGAVHPRASSSGAVLPRASSSRAVLPRASSSGAVLPRASSSRTVLSRLPCLFVKVWNLGAVGRLLAGNRFTSSVVTTYLPFCFCFFLTVLTVTFFPLRQSILQLRNGRSGMNVGGGRRGRWRKKWRMEGETGRRSEEGMNQPLPMVAW